jgi:hypothetical protein
LAKLSVTTKPVDLHHGLDELLGRFLGQVVSNAARHGPVEVLAGELGRVRARNLLVRCDGGLPLRELLAGAATATGAPAGTVARKGAAATRHLIEAGFLLPR